MAKLRSGEYRQRFGLDTGANSLYSRLRQQGVSDEQAQLNVYNKRGVLMKDVNAEYKAEKKTEKEKYRKAIDDMNKGKTPILEWNESDIIDAEVDYRFEYENEEGLSKEQIRDKMYVDPDITQMAWEDLKTNLTEDMKKVTGKTDNDVWHVEVENFGWQSKDGEGVIRAKDGEELLQKVLPDTDNTFKIFKDGKSGFKIQNFHHDSPTGREWYYIRKVRKKEYDKMEGDIR